MFKLQSVIWKISTKIVEIDIFSIAIRLSAVPLDTFYVVKGLLL